MSRPRFIDQRTAILIVVANMIGTGVFTTLGLQAAGIPDGAALLMLWLIGGLIALCGALSYAELAAALPRSGGEYHFLSRIFHPLLGQLAGWVSVTVGFAAPVALAAMAMGHYAATVLPAPPTAIAVTALVMVTAVHAFDLDLGRRVQVVATWLKIAVILLFCAVGLALPATSDSLSVVPRASTLGAVWSAPFAVSLIYVAYAYSGWNAAAYVVDEVQDPHRAVPRALLLGTLIVTLLYLLLNLTFLRTVEYAALVGRVEVGALSAETIFGAVGGHLMSLVLTLLLVSTVSAMVLAGPRVLERIGEDIPFFRPLSVRNRRGAPTRAVLLQQGLALAMILTGSFEGVLSFAGFTLTLFAVVTVAGVIRLRRREPDLPRPFRVPWYPLPPLVFMLVSLASLLFLALERPLPVFLAIILLGLGWVSVRLSGRR
ncbi:APC family permease [Thiocapsa sp. UBA6158]|jgi:APA family basic amino acid/polyamine antiporter|uniref:APC family permease n=1 Tax=Thiocapsa sp. UBA6158 TaxID=1947692 RepID=UPI0025E74382|nr:amino acid permease [Thiocapsa sp. UBA6158]